MNDLTEMDNAALAAHAAATWKAYRVANARHDLANAEHGYGSDEASAARKEKDRLISVWSSASSELKRRARAFLTENGFGVDADVLAQVIQ